MRACIHSIETFGTLDGPGIRNVIFFQGCPLRCLYCHNADTRTIKEANYNINELMNSILRYKPYFEASGGGITVSGGEPTMQAEFVCELFKRCQKQGINTALDTCGYVDIGVAKKIIPHTNLVLLDIKHIDDNMCIKLTGKTNKKSIELLEYLNEKKVPVYLRQVIIEGWTDSIDYIKRLGNFANRYSCIEKVELLPYHKMGEDKWNNIGISPPFKDIPPFPKNKAKEYAALLNKDFGLKAV